METQVRTEQQAPTEDPIFGPVISMYTRAQAIEDGVLVDVTDTAKEAGIRGSMVLTRAAWNEWVEVPPNKGAEGQSIRGRLWDVVYMAKMFAVPFLIRRASMSGDPETTYYKFNYISRKGRRTATAKCHLGYGDNGEGVWTVMMPEED